MVEAVLTNEMKVLLSKMKDKKILSYECEKDDGFSRTFGNLRINLDTFSIEITNEEHTLPFFEGEEDVTYFECKEVNPQEVFVPYVVTETAVKEVNQIITGIELINDTINVNDGEYEISFDEAIIIHMDTDTLMLARDTWFSEIISIRDNDDYNQIFSVDEVKEEWSNEGEKSVSIERKRITIC
ncbi:MAG: hypothetical protein IJH82_04035 [Lachnospiraceae bacterium]|nr:hypothetical protein [Lachnospiraceae bacterium]